MYVLVAVPPFVNEVGPCLADLQVGNVFCSLWLH